MTTALQKLAAFAGLAPKVGPGPESSHLKWNLHQPNTVPEPGPEPAPPMTDGEDWYIEHEALSHALVQLVLVSLSQRYPLADHDRRLIRQAQADLRSHAQLVVGHTLPAIAARDGRNLIAFEELAEARAKAKMLGAELERARAKLAQAYAPAVRSHKPAAYQAHAATRRLASNQEGIKA